MRVLVAASTALARAGLEALLAREPELQVVGVVASDEALLDAVEGAEAEVLLLEAAPGGEPPLPLALAADAAGRAPAVVLLADLAAAGAAERLRAGARAVLPRDAAPEEIVAAVHAAAAGLVALPRALAAELLDELPRPRRAPLAAGAVALTPRETEVLAMLAEGLGNKSIARRLGLSEHTVKTHVAAVLQKLDASTRTEAVAAGVRRGLVVL